MAFLAFYVAFSAKVAAQTLTASGGTSTLLNASGFQFDYKWAPVSGWVGTGFNPGLHLGGFLGTTYEGTEFGFGDRLFPFVLDTDVLDRSYYFNGRGFSVSRRSDNQNWTLFSGSTTREFSTPFLRSFDSGDPAGAVFYARKLRPRLTFHSSNVFKGEVTSIQSLNILLYPHWKADLAGGAGANSGYLSTATEYDSKRLDLKASYTASNDRFRRIQISSPLSPERRGLNVRLRYSPLQTLRFELDHENILSPTLGARNSVRASLNSVNASGSFAGFEMSGGLSASRGGRTVVQTELLNLSRKLGPHFTGYATLLRFRSPGNPTVGVFLTTAEEKISPRWSVRQKLARTNSSNSVSWGGSLLSNPLSLAIDYQTLFTPLAGGINGRQFLQAWVVTAQAQIPRGIKLHYGTFVDPFGRIRHTVFLSDFRYATHEHFASTPASAPPIYPYVARGLVEDERGQPVWGIAIEIDGQLVYSDNHGRFFLRVRRPGEYTVRIAGEHSLNPGLWETVFAASAVRAERSSAAIPVKIVVRRASRGNTSR